MERSRDFVLMPPGEGPSFSVVGDIYTFKAVSEDTGGAYSLFEFLIPPQSGSPPHIHTRENETFYILEGELSFQVGDQKMVLPVGSYVHAPKGIAHSFKNEGTTPVKTLTAVVPAGLEKFFEEVGYPVTDKDTPVPVTREDQIKKMIEVAPKYGIEMLPPPTIKTVNEDTRKDNYASRFPGVMADTVKRLFARGEAFDSDGFITFFTENALYQFGNFEPVFGHAAIKESANNFFRQIAAVYHDIKMMWEVENVVFVEMDVIYTRHDESRVSLPCTDIFRMDGDKFSELRIFMDVNPVFDTTIVVSQISSVMTVGPVVK